MKKTVLLSIAAPDAAFDRMQKELKAVADVRVCGLTDYSLDGVDVFIGKKLDGGKLDAADRLKAVFAYKTGVDDFPCGKLKERGIALYNSHINSGYIAQYAFGMGIALVNRISEFDRKMRRGDWKNDDPYWRSIFDMKAGLVGYGGIGRELAALLTANGIETYTIDRGKDYGVTKPVSSLEELCRACDILFLSLPKTAETDCMFDKRVFSLLKGKYIVNVGRSNCIDESALYASLTNGGLAGAAIDTWRAKPQAPDELLLPFDLPFNELDNVVLSSHKAMQLLDGHDKYVADVTENVKSYLAGKPPRNAVDLDVGY